MATGAALATGSVLVSAGASQEVEDLQRSFEEPRGWSSHHGNTGNSATVPLDGWLPAPTSVAWEYDHTGDVAVVDQVVYLRTDGEVHSLEAEDGTVRWESDDIGAAGTPAVVDDAVYVGGDAVTALEAPTGEVRWRTGFESESQVPDPTVAFETVYVVVDGTLYALDRSDGSIRWERESVTLENRDGEKEEVRFASTPVAGDEESIYAGVGDAGFVALDPVTGDEQWSHQKLYHATHVNYHDYLVVGAGRLFTGQISEAERFPVLDAMTGERLESTTYRFPLAVTETANVTAGRNGFRAYHYDTEYSWSVGGSLDAWGRPIVVGRTVVVAHHPYTDEMPELYGFDLENGDELWSFSLGKLGIAEDNTPMWPHISYVSDGDTLYVSTRDRIAALRSSEDGGEDSNGNPPRLSVQAPESIEYREEADPAEDGADFDVTVTNRRNETTAIEVRLEVDSIDEPVFLELGSGETDTAHYTVTSRDLGAGEHDWTVSANDETETGTLVVTEQKEC
ncbi:PQQ-binding-like beta-propeller repeat protein [Natronosalvus rutilus]|uniref:PQQ-binding-like beta-propeller repeat protein n=1 Tax=Natronosalvus rutilus TaxID=2953753 RepID=A0A9E7SUN1_9EURY|nr:PQQ-binding-like beta-propeller repeat protein [Natronosalvus rutilus]UTF52151.1 PQQ-binding-like beta-propeller repeat protein [Natronosalvus rutilus]